MKILRLILSPMTPEQRGIVETVYDVDSGEAVVLATVPELLELEVVELPELDDPVVLPELDDPVVPPEPPVVDPEPEDELDEAVG